MANIEDFILRASWKIDIVKWVLSLNKALIIIIIIIIIIILKTIYSWDPDEASTKTWGLVWDVKRNKTDYILAIFQMERMRICKFGKKKKLFVEI